jgi:uncharacterized Rmd1/YagE family protein
MTFVRGDVSKVSKDEITLESDDIYEMLAHSYGMAQSVKLSYYEDDVDRTIDAHKPLLDELRTTGNIQMSSTEINKRLGHLFTTRA